MRLIMGLKYLARDTQILEANQPCVFVSNHQNNIDIIAGCLSLPRKTVSLGKSSIVFVPIFGLFYWLSGNILINRMDKKKAKKSMSIVTKVLQKDTSVWIMPEGTRNFGKGLLSFKLGAFRTAIDAGVPIVPICFNTYAKTANLNKLNSGIIVTQVLEPIQTTGLSKSDASALANKCFALMEETIAKLDDEFPG